jgi:hypothetical protein
MKHIQGFGSVVLLELIVFGMVMFAASPAGAATAAGPYYANPSWDQTLPASTRFIVLSHMNGEAVLDRETGLVWQQSPSTSPRLTWLDAQIHCNELAVSNRIGWRLPTFQELASLVDRSQLFPALPADHPFSNVQLSDYWSATTFARDPSGAWAVVFNVGGIIEVDEGSAFFARCVRGGQGADAQ